MSEINSRAVRSFFKRPSVILAAILGILFVLGVVGLIIWRVFWVTFVDNYELAFSFNRFTGKIEIINRTGWITRTPWVSTVHKIDLRPHQVTINANARVLNAKLVRFNPSGLNTFVEWHGRAAGDDTRNLVEILKSYAFDLDGGKDCPFLTVENVVAPRQVARLSTNVVGTVSR